MQSIMTEPHRETTTMTKIQSCAYELMTDTTVLMLTQDDMPFASIKIEFDANSTCTTTIMIHDEKLFNRVPVTCAPHLLALAIATIEEVRAESADPVEIYADLEYPIDIRF
jgi:SUMO ligase MMS21 Smc5/6 complex component